MKSSDLWNGQNQTGLTVVPTGIAYPDDAVSPDYPTYSGNIFLASEAFALLHTQSTLPVSEADAPSGFEPGNEYGYSVKFDDGESVAGQYVKGAWPGSVRCMSAD